MRRTNAQGDFNGDHADDTLSVYGTGTADHPGPYHVHIALGNGVGAVDAALDGADPTGTTPVQALGGADLTASAGAPPDGSGDEAFVQIGAGASVSLVAIFQLADCTAIRLKDLQGQPTSFAIGGSVTHQGGLRCDGAAGGQRLVLLSATSDDGVTYATTETRLQVVNGQFTAVNTVNGSINGNDPRLQAFGTLDCPGVASP